MRHRLMIRERFVSRVARLARFYVKSDKSDSSLAIGPGFSLSKYWLGFDPIICRNIAAKAPGVS